MISTITFRYCNKQGHIENDNVNYCEEDEENNFKEAFTSDANESQVNQKIGNDNLWFFDIGWRITWQITKIFYITIASFHKHYKLHSVTMAQKLTLAKGKYTCL